MKKTLLWALAFAAVLTLTACGNGSKDLPGEPAGESSEEAADYSVLTSDWWFGGAMSIDGEIISVDDNIFIAGLAHDYIIFGDDGSYSYHYLIFTNKGTYEKIAGRAADYLLQTTINLRWDRDKNGKHIEVENTDIEKRNYIITLVDENTFSFGEYDPETGGTMPGDVPVYFVRQNSVSDFIEQNSSGPAGQQPTDTPKPASTPEPIKPAPTKQPLKPAPQYSRDYGDILDEYTEKMEEAVDGLVMEYRREAAGVYDLYALAELCNEKVGELAEICNEGVAEMAELMFKNNDSYDTYEKWSGRLMDNYMDIAMEIQNAYLDSAM